MPNRIIKESIKRSPEIDRLSWFEEVVFYRLIVTADDYGRLDGRTVVLKNDLFPTKETVSKKSIEDAIAHLASVGLLVPYVDRESGMPCLCLRKWEKHQTIRNKHSKFPAPPQSLIADCKQLLADCKQTSADCMSESESNPNPNQNPNQNPKENETRARTALAPVRHKYGQYDNVLLSEADMVKLRTEFPKDWEQRIEKLSEYMASKGTTYKNHLATIRNWARMEKERNGKTKPMPTAKDYEGNWEEVFGDG